jgi:hypothetical protein
MWVFARIGKVQSVSVSLRLISEAGVSWLDERQRTPSQHIVHVLHHHLAHVARKARCASWRASERKMRDACC